MGHVPIRPTSHLEGGLLQPVAASELAHLQVYDSLKITVSDGRLNLSSLIASFVGPWISLPPLILFEVLLEFCLVFYHYSQQYLLARLIVLIKSTFYTQQM